MASRRRQASRSSEMARKISSGAGRGPHGRHQSVAGRRGAGGAPVSATSPRLRRAAWRTRHRQRGSGRSRPGERPAIWRRSRRRRPRRSVRPATSPTASIARRSSACCARTRSTPSSISAATIPPTPCASSPRRRGRRELRSRAIHIPKTIDNDLVGFDHTPGYPFRGAVRGAGVHGGQSRQCGAAGRLLSLW